MRCRGQHHGRWGCQAGGDAVDHEVASQYGVTCRHVQVGRAGPHHLLPGVPAVGIAVTEAVTEACKCIHVGRATKTAAEAVRVLGF